MTDEELARQPAAEDAIKAIVPMGIATVLFALLAFLTPMSGVGSIVLALWIAVQGLGAVKGSWTAARAFDAGEAKVELPTAELSRMVATAVGGGVFAVAAVGLGLAGQGAAADRIGFGIGVAAGFAAYFALTKSLVQSKQALALCGLVGALGFCVLFAGSGTGSVAGASFFVVAAGLAGAAASWMWSRLESRQGETNLE